MIRIDGCGCDVVGVGAAVACSDARGLDEDRACGCVCHRPIPNAGALSMAAGALQTHARTIFGEGEVGRAACARMREVARWLDALTRAHCRGCGTPLRRYRGAGVDGWLCPECDRDHVVELEPV